MELYVYRDIFTKDATGGILYVGDIVKEKVCYTLEDACRGKGIKVYGETCVPAGHRYRVGVNKSDRFGRDMLIIYNCADGYTLRADGILFTGIRAHGGNDSDDTLGCLLVAYNRISNTVIQGTAEKEVTKLVKDAIARGEEVWIEYFDHPLKAA